MLLRRLTNELPFAPGRGQVLAGLVAMHTAGVAHRDVKLENLILKRPGDLSTVKAREAAGCLTLLSPPLVHVSRGV